MFREVTPVSHSNLKTHRTNYEGGVGNDPTQGWTLLNVLDSSTKGFLEIFSNVPVVQKRILSFTYRRSEESCSTFNTL